MSVDAFATPIGSLPIATLSDAGTDASPAPVGPLPAALAEAVLAAGSLSADSVILVPERGWAVALKRALYERSAKSGQAWLPPVVDTLEALADAALPVAHVRPREERLLAVAGALGETGGGAWAARLLRAGPLLDAIDAIARTGICAWLAGGARDPLPAWDEAAVAERLLQLAEVRGGGIGAALLAEWRTIARIGRVVATEADPLPVLARQAQCLLRQWSLSPPTVWHAAVSAPPRRTGGLATTTGDCLLAAFRQALPALVIKEVVADPALLVGPVDGLFARAWPETLEPDLDVGSDQWPGIGTRRIGPSGEGAAVAAGEILHALDREDESMRAARWIHRQLQDGPKCLAIVVFDRWLARRTRALLERAAILIDDREGWALSTTVAATWPMAWLELCELEPPDGRLAAQGAAAIAIGSLLDSAFTRHPLAAALARDLRRRALGERGETPPRVAALESRLIELIQTQRAARQMGEQVAILRRAMATLEADGALRADEAGRQVLAMADRLAGARPDGARRCNHEAFRALLGFFLERQRFHDSAIQSPVVMLGLEAALLQRFDAVLVLGANAGQLPSAMPTPPGLIDALLPGLGLPDARQQRQVQVAALATLLHATARWAVTCRSDSADGSLPSPLIERLAAVCGLDLHALAGASQPAWRSIAATTTAVDHFPMPRPAESATLPAALSVSAIDRLAQCPFRFLVNDVWQLNEPRESEEEPGKRELGIVVHAVLLRFHRELVRPDDFSDDELVARLAAHTDAVLREEPALQSSRLVHLREWQALLPQYVAAFRQDHAEGWRFLRGEDKAEATLMLRAGRVLRLHGKFDRLDRRAEAACADGAEQAATLRVVDYKLRAGPAVSGLAADADRSVQLMLYAWFTEAHDAAYLSIDRHAIRAYPVNPPPGEQLEVWRARLMAVLERIDDGEPLRALGEQCDLCSARGVCRQGHWRDEAVELASGHVDMPGSGA